MNLTKKGRDYIKAIILLSIVASLLDVSIMLALSFTLSIVAVISFLIVLSVTRSNTKVVIDPVAVRGFKGDELVTSVVLIFKRARWITVNLSSVEGPFGVDTKFKMEDNVAKVSIKSKYAGNYSGLTLQLEVRDVLDLFSKKIQAIYTDFILDSLPSSMLVPIAHSRPLPLALGDRSGRSPGSSLELYALDDYQPYTETKNILWKRVARMPDERLIIRIRDSSIPRVIRVGVIRNIVRMKEDRLVWMDLVCEGIGSMGNNLLATGCSIEVISTSLEGEDPIVINNVTNLDELSNALMGLSDPPNPGKENRNLFDVIARADIIVCGMKELQDRVLSLAISKKPTLMIAEENAAPFLVGQQAMIYTGVEDVRKLISKVLEM